MTPRPRAALLRANAALALIDATGSGHGHGPNRQDEAFKMLADALNEMHGPLPDIRIRGWDEAALLAERDDDIGAELAEREGRE